MIGQHGEAAVAFLLACLVHIFVEKPTEAMRERFRRTSGEEQEDEISEPSAVIVGAVAVDRGSEFLRE